MEMFDAKASENETLELIEQICKIPAPSLYEEKRAEFCKNWLCSSGAEGVYIDSAQNVLYPVGCDGREDIILFSAHMDTVFPDMETMPFSKDDKYIYSPGVGDNAANLAALLTIAKFVAQNKLKAPCGILFAANTGEEGQGNLKGIRQIMEDYKGRIKKVYTFDLYYHKVYNRCVGSHRYEIEVKTRGGHSFNDFGNDNAIHILSELVCNLYKCKVPVQGDSKTTYNVGNIEGGTSVNTIAESAKLLYEYRSDSMVCLEKMKEFFKKEIKNIKEQFNVDISVKLLGIRPCGGEVDFELLADMTEKVVKLCEKHSGMCCNIESASTDCNVPMSMGIPAVCLGTCLGDGAHTRGERVLIESIPTGLKIAAELILSCF